MISIMTSLGMGIIQIPRPRLFNVAVFQNDRKHVGRNLIQTSAAIFIL